MSQLIAASWSVRLLYLYLFAFVGLFISIIGSIQLTDLGLKTYVFRVSDYPLYSGPEFASDSKIAPEEQTRMQEQQRKIQEQEAQNQRKRQVSTAVAMIVVGAPVYLYHWHLIKHESTHKKSSG